MNYSGSCRRFKDGLKAGFPPKKIKNHDLFTQIWCLRYYSIDNKPYEGILNIGVTPTVSR